MALPQSVNLGGLQRQERLKQSIKRTGTVGCHCQAAQIHLFGFREAYWQHNRLPFSCSVYGNPT